jgi:Holliday junction resolvase RusA-like endonuclease
VAGNSEIVLRIAGQSSTKQRPRFNAFLGRAYQPAANIINENDVRAVWREAGEPRIEDDTAIEIAIIISVERPKGHFKADGSLSKAGQENPVPRNKKPDLDNAAKLVFDALNTRAYHDDVRIAKAVVERRWGDWPETVIVLRPYSGDTA